MSLFDAIVLGIIQGLTEFLPVSSSGHLVLAEAWLGKLDQGVTFVVLIHLGTLASVFIYFRRQLTVLIQSLYTPKMKRERKIVWFLILGTIPAGLAGVLLKDFFESTFNNPVETSIELIITGGILLLPLVIRKGAQHLNWLNVLIMGIGQAIAILPGISRSGTTIVAGMLCGVKPAEAAEFSFLLSIPAILGAAVLEIPHLNGIASALVVPYAVATLCSFVFGLAAVYLVMASVRRGKFEYFAFYCFAIGALGLYLFL